MSVAWAGLTFADVFDLELTFEIGIDSTSPSSFSNLTPSLIHSSQGNGSIETLPLGLSLSVCTIGMEAWLMRPELLSASQNEPTLTVAGWGATRSLQQQARAG